VVVISTSYYSMVLLNTAARGENLPPVVLVRPVTVEYGNQFQVEGTYASDAGSFDPNLDQLAYEWTDSEGRIIGDWAVFSWRSALPPGTYPFKLTLRDGRGGTASDTLLVTISPMKESVAHLAWSAVAGAWRQVDDPTAARALALASALSERWMAPGPDSDPRRRRHRRPDCAVVRTVPESAARAGQERQDDSDPAPTEGLKTTAPRLPHAT
jgi:hypothetical protein